MCVGGVGGMGRMLVLAKLTVSARAHIWGEFPGHRVELQIPRGDHELEPGRSSCPETVKAASPPRVTRKGRRR